MASRGKKTAVVGALFALLEKPGNYSTFWEELFYTDSPDPNERIAAAMLGYPAYHDRVAGIIYASMLEQSLELAIATHFTDPQNNKIFSYNDDGPLSTLSAKINMASALGVAGPSMRADLMMLKNIRNVFAHARIDVHFKTPAIVAACDQLILPKNGRSFMFSNPPRPQFKTPRSRYIGTIAALTTYLGARQGRRPVRFKRSAAYRHIYPTP